MARHPFQLPRLWFVAWRVHDELRRNDELAKHFLQVTEGSGSIPKNLGTSRDFPSRHARVYFLSSLVAQYVTPHSAKNFSGRGRFIGSRTVGRRHLPGCAGRCVHCLGPGIWIVFAERGGFPGSSERIAALRDIWNRHFRNRASQSCRWRAIHLCAILIGPHSRSS